MRLVDAEHPQPRRAAAHPRDAHHHRIAWSRDADVVDPGANGEGAKCAEAVLAKRTEAAGRGAVLDGDVADHVDVSVLVGVDEGRDLSEQHDWRSKCSTRVLQDHGRGLARFQVGLAAHCVEGAVFIDVPEAPLG